MPHDITETPQYNAGPIELPDNGEIDGIESIEPAFQELMDRGALALSGISGLMRGADEFAVEPGGTSSNFDITVGGIQSLVLPNEGGSAYNAFFYVTGSPTITEANIAGGVLANSTRYYVYAFNNAGTLAFEIVTDAPRASRVHKTGSGAGPVARRYLGTFYTSSAGAPIPCRAVRGVYTFRRSALGLNVLRAYNGSDTSWTSVDLSGFIPPHARVARVELVAGSGGTIGSAQLRTTGDTAGGFYAANVLGTIGDTDRMAFEVETDASRTVQCQVSHSSISAELFVHGFSE